MIVEPDFPDHWKTRLLVEELDCDEAAPVYILRLWAHCQHRKTNVFENLSDKALKALCRYPGHPNKLEAGLIASGFVRRDSHGFLTVHQWDQYNASLFANWENGKKGGRPRKQNPERTESQPAENPNETHGLSMANPNETDREDKIRRELIEKENAAREIPETPPPDPDRRAAWRKRHGYPELKQAKEAAPQAGKTPQHAEDWWRYRDADDWQIHRQNGTSTLVSKNWRGDMVRFAGTQRQGLNANGKHPQKITEPQSADDLAAKLGGTYRL
jgi:hypothetical protein